MPHAGAAPARGVARAGLVGAIWPLLLGEWVDGEDPERWGEYRTRLRHRLEALIEDGAPLNLFERAEAGRAGQWATRARGWG